MIQSRKKKQPNKNNTPASKLQNSGIFLLDLISHIHTVKVSYLEDFVGEIRMWSHALNANTNKLTMRCDITSKIHVCISDKSHNIEVSECYDLGIIKSNVMIKP